MLQIKEMQLSLLARTCALITALMAASSLALQFVVVWRETGGNLGQTLWIMARFFTILTNTLVAVVFGAMAIAGHRARDRVVAGLVLWIAAVGLVYHVLLSALWEPEGLRYLADQGLHSGVPLAVVGWWLVFGGRDRLQWIDPLFWMIWPVLYLAYALVRGAADGIYPYPFLDPTRVPWPQLVWNVSRLMEGFLIGGYALLEFSALRRGRYVSDNPSSSSR